MSAQSEQVVHRTTNNKGIVFKELLRINRNFEDYAIKSATKPVIDLGSANGLASKAVLAAGRKVIACDIDKEALKALRSGTPSELLSHLETREGCFPAEFEFAPGSISAVHCANMLHFLKDEEVMEGLSKIKKWLEPGGKLFLCVATPFVPAAPGFAAEFEQRAKTERWPGSCDKATLARIFVPVFPEFFGEKSMFDYINVFDEHVMRRALTEAGYDIEDIFYFGMENPGELEPFLGPAGHPCFLGAIASA